MRVIRSRAAAMQRLIDSYILPELRDMHAQAKKNLTDPGSLLLDINNAGTQAKEISTILAGMILETEGRRRSA